MDPSYRIDSLGVFQLLSDALDRATDCSKAEMSHILQVSLYTSCVTPDSSQVCIVIPLAADVADSANPDELTRLSIALWFSLCCLVWQYVSFHPPEDLWKQHNDAIEVACVACENRISDYTAIPLQVQGEQC